MKSFDEDKSARSTPFTDGEPTVGRATRNLPGRGIIEPDPFVYGFSPPPPPITYPGEPPSAPRWIDANESPFGVRVLDCRSVALKMVSTSKSPEVLNYFASPAALRGEQFRAVTPANPQIFVLYQRYRGLHIPETEGPVYLAEVMEDKWDIFRFGDALFFVRSWSGTLVHRARFAALDDEIVITEVSTETSRGDSATGLQETAEIDFLLRTHLRRERVPAPLPPGVAGSGAPEFVAMAASSRFGRWASFATEADITGVTWREQRSSAVKAMLPPTFESFDGTPIHCWAALSADLPPRAKVVLVHGFGTHSESLHFGYLRDHLTGEGFAVYGFDLRGFGRSGGRRAYVHRWSDFRNDLRLFVDAAERGGETAPLFVLGVSLGGLIAVDYALHNPEQIQGLIAMSPALDTSGVPVSRRLLLRALSNIFPTLALNTGLDVTRLTRDQEAQRKFLSDPLRQTKMTLRLASETIAAMAETAELLPHLKPALLVLHGSADVIIPPVAGKRLHDLAGCADKEFRAFEGAFHILSMETNREEVFDCINSWIARRLTSTPPVGSFRDGPER